jgi:hypothetical protein
VDFPPEWIFTVVILQILVWIFEVDTLLEKGRSDSDSK